MSRPSWSNYQREAALLFRSLGFEAENDVRTQGVRAVHMLDATVRFTRFGISHFWVVECKEWASKVSKEKVMALSAIIQDVGADKRFLFSERGFQAGAIRAARMSNIVLTSIAELRADAEIEMRELAIRDASDRYESVMIRLHEIPWRAPSKVADSLTSYAPKDFYQYVGRASLMESSLKNARHGKFPVLLEIDEEQRHKTTSDIFELLATADALLKALEVYIESHKDFRKDYEARSKRIGSPIKGDETSKC